MQKKSKERTGTHSLADDLREGLEEMRRFARGEETGVSSGRITIGALKFCSPGTTSFVLARKKLLTVDQSVTASVSGIRSKLSTTKTKRRPEFDAACMI